MTLFFILTDKNLNQEWKFFKLKLSQEPNSLHFNTKCYNTGNKPMAKFQSQSKPTLEMIRLPQQEARLIIRTNQLMRD